MSESNIASLSQSSDTEALLGTKEFVLIREIDIGNADDCVSVFAILGSPVETRVLGPIEVSNVFDLIGKHAVMHSLEELLLIDLNGDQSFDLSSDELVRKIVTTHVGQVIHHCVDFCSLGLECLYSVSCALQAVSHLLCKQELHSKKGNLRLVFVHKVYKGRVEAFSCTGLADRAHGDLHSAFEFDEPVFNVAFTFDWVI